MADARAEEAVVEAEKADRARPGNAISEADLLRARLPGFACKIDRALDVIRQASEKGRVGTSYSGGKDSQCVLDLVRRVLPDSPVAFFDSGAELESTRAIVAHYGVTTIHPRLTFQEMARYVGKWGYVDPVDPGCPFDFGMILIHEPAETFVVRERLMVCAIGLRGQESGGRWMNAVSRGELYQREDRTWCCCPLAFWSTDDVWAYIASRGLAYNEAYDRMAELGIPRDQQRISTLLGDRAAGAGKYAILKRLEPHTFNRLAAEFPDLRSYA